MKKKINHKESIAWHKLVLIGRDYYKRKPGDPPWGRGTGREVYQCKICKKIYPDKIRRGFERVLNSEVSK